MEEVTRYEVFLFCHLLAVVAWVGADLVIQVLAIRAHRAGGERMLHLLDDVSWLGTRYLVPASLIVVAFGFALIGESDGAYELGQFWVAAGLGVFIASFLMGAGFLGPETGKIAKLAETTGPDDPEVERRIRRVFFISRIELVLLILVVFDMVVKPGL
jgi:Predicted integral membrane protein (DUF2269)